MQPFGNYRMEEIDALLSCNSVMVEWGERISLERNKERERGSLSKDKELQDL